MRDIQLNTLEPMQQVQIQINYKKYPECMFAMISAFLPAEEGNDLRRVAGRVEFKSEDKNGNTYKNGLLHSYDDLPAIIDSEGTKQWYKNGQHYMTEFSNGTKAWYNGNINEVEFPDGTRNWYKDGKLHRDNDLPAIIHSDGTRQWYKDGKLHRDYDEPAHIDSEQKVWYKNGLAHRDNNLPAVINYDGTALWYRHGKCYGEN